jgi:protein phosphatase
LPQALRALRQTGERLDGDARERLNALTARVGRRAAAVDQFVAAYRRYCWPVASLDDFKLAPFHLLATETQVHCNKPHTWHMETLAKVAAHDPLLFVTTRHKPIDLSDADAEQQGIEWWGQLTAAGGEGMVVKPGEFVVRSKKGLLQPAVKCRGSEYLRIIYGPDYDAPEHLSRLRNRNVAAKRSLAVREFALGIEALERFVRREPLRRVHECVFGVLALESEPVDPRL